MHSNKHNKKRSIPQTIGYVLLCISLVAIGWLGANVLELSKRTAEEMSLTPTPAPSAGFIQLITPDPSLPTPTPTEQMLRNGAKGPEVEKLQARLKELGFYQGEVDGQFGNGTKAAVILFQSQHGLEADGIVGPATKELIYSDQARQIVITPTPAPTPTPDPSSSIAANRPILVNRQNPIPEDYKPRQLVNLRQECPGDLVTIKGSDIQGEKEAVDALVTMLRAAHKDGITVWQVSAGYRSIAYQKELFDNQVKAYMAEGKSRSDAISATRLTVADPGASEHHTGLAFDITVPGTTFKGTKQALWLSAHCWDYGFIIRYEEDKEKITGYIAEPWHIRYVGLPHSIIMRDHAWALEEYLEQMDQ